MALGRRIRTIARFLLKASIGLVALSLFAVIVLRFLAPPVSALMVERRIGSWFGEARYSPKYLWVDLEQIAPSMTAAVIAAEDQKFPDHYGFDLPAIQRALGHNGRNARTRGASTLTQQTAKNLFLWPSRSWLRKGAEAYFTVLLETLWDKRRILETYLNIVEFGDGIYGVEAASQHYFKKPASRLNTEEAAILAAVLPSPRRYKVKTPSVYVRQRQQWILQQMRDLGGSSLVKRFE